MRERARKIGGHIDVWNRAEAGTEVELHIAACVAYVPEPTGSWLWKLRRLGHERNQGRNKKMVLARKDIPPLKDQER